jgi:uncharacterized membrane protein
LGCSMSWVILFLASIFLTSSSLRLLSRCKRHRNIQHHKDRETPRLFWAELTVPAPKKGKVWEV